LVHEEGLNDKITVKKRPKGVKKEARSTCRGGMFLSKEQKVHLAVGTPGIF
jgi:hypothetical protein